MKKKSKRGLGRTTDKILAAWLLDIQRTLRNVNLEVRDLNDRLESWMTEMKLQNQLQQSEHRATLQEAIHEVDRKIARLEGRVDMENRLSGLQRDR